MVKRTSSLRALLMGVSVLGFTAVGAGAASVTWESNPSDNKWTSPSNWSGGSVPGSSDTAEFGSSSQTAIDILDDTTFIDAIQLDAGAPAYTFNLKTTSADSTFTLSGSGVVDNSSNAPTFNLSTDGTHAEELTFSNSASSGDSQINLLDGLTGVGYLNSASAGTSVITISGTPAASNATGGALTFANSATAASASVVINGGYTFFRDSSTAGSASFTLNSSVNGSGRHVGGNLEFDNTSTASSATINVYAGTVTFNNSATAGSANITLTDTPGAQYLDPPTDSITNPDAGYHAVLNFTGSSTAGSAAIHDNGGQINFSNSSTAGNASIDIEAGGAVGFADNSNAGSATIVDNGSVDFSLTSGASGNHKVTAAEISGSGTVNLGGNELTLGGDNGSVTFSGAMLGTGSLVKTGSGTLTITGTNIFTGSTTISAGTLQIGDGSHDGSLKGAIVDDAALILDLPDPTTVANLISGTGTIEDKGTGPVAFTALNTVSGTTTIDAGAQLSFGDGTTAGSVGGAVVDNGKLIFNEPTGANITFAGNISGSGAVSQIGPDPVTLTGTNGFTGALTINAATLTVPGAASLGVAGGDIAIQANGTLAFTGATSSTDLIALTGGGTIDTGANAVTWSGVISGASAVLTKTGTGTLTLTGTNAYDGGTVISDGALVVGDGATNGAIAGVITDNSTLAFNHSDTYTDAGAISGSGALQQIGSGTLILTGNNIYSGTTTVGNGTLQIGNGGTTGAVTSDITNNANLVFDRSNTYTYGNVISGAGTANQSGTGTTILTGANTYTGATVISSGALQIGSGGATGSIDSTSGVTDNSALIYDVSGSPALTYVISGSGKFTQAGSGNVTLNATETYIGGTFVNAGTLTLGASGSLAPSGNLTVATGATFDMTNHAQTVGVLSGGGTIKLGSGLLQVGNGTNSEFSGTITGTGSFKKIGTGTLALSGNNSYTGTTDLEVGTIQLGNGGTSGAIAGNITDVGVLAFDRSDTYTYAGVISGSGAVTQMGTGKTVLSGTNTYTGATTVNGGTLSVNGSIASSSGVTVNSGGTLGGTGTVSTTEIASGGHLAPGNSIGTLNVNGNLTLDAGSTFDVEVSALASDLVSVSGTTTIAGGFNAIATGGSYTGGKTYTVLTSAGGVSGGFSGMTVSGSFGSSFTPVLSYDADNVYLTLKVTSFIWSTNPVSSDWNTNNNWQGGLTPGASDTAVFDAATNSAVTIKQAGTVVSALQFNAGGPAYSISVVADAAHDSALTITGIGVIDGSSTPPVLSASGVAGHLGTITFANSSGAADTTVAANAYGQVLFTGNAVPGNARLISQSAGAIDFSGTSGAGSNHQLTAASIEGAGSFLLGSNQLTVGSNNVSTEVSGVIADGGASGGSGGQLVKTGTGTLILSGDNTYTGGTKILDGTLQLGNGGYAGSVSGWIYDNALLVFDRSDIVTVANSIGGSGSVTQSGPGTIIIAGTDSYTGGTTVAAGTLQIGDGTTNGSIVGDIADNGVLIFKRTDTAVFAGNISGSGAVQIEGGTTVFTGNASYGGGTQIVSGATLQIGNNGTSGSISGAIVDDGTLAFARSDDASYAGDVSGSGTITKSGGGALTLTGSDTTSGALSVLGGTVQLGNGGTSGSVAGNIALSSGTTLAVNRSDTYTYDGVISGAGGFVQAGSGNTVFTGSNTYTGGTTISNGALTLGDGRATGSFAGDVTDNGMFAINRSDVFTFAAVISGSGGFVQSGAGTTVLTAMNNYGGPTAVNAGKLQVDGSIAASSGVTVASGATLTGTGTVAGTTVSSGAKIAPGDGGIGTLTVAGNLTLASGATYASDVSPTAIDMLRVSGSASLDGTVAFSAAAGTYACNQQFTVLTASNGVSGSFAGLTVDGSFGKYIKPVLKYGPNSVVLVLDPTALTPLLPDNANRNQRNVFTAVDPSFGNNTAPQPFLDLANLAPSDLAAAGTQLSGEIGASVQQQLLQLSAPFLEDMADPSLNGRGGFYGEGSLAGRRRAASDNIFFNGKATLWGKVAGGSATIDGDATPGTHNVTSTLGGVTAGLDFRLLPNLVVGAAVDSAVSNWHLSDSLGTGHARALQGGVYGTAQAGDFYATAVVSGGRFSVKTNRTVTVGGNQQYAANFDVTAYGGRVETGYRFHGTLLRLTPYVAFSDQQLSIPAYAEKTASGSNVFALDMAKRTTDDPSGEFGVQFGRHLADAVDGGIVLRGRLAWLHDFGGAADAAASFQSIQASDFTVYGARSPHDATLALLGLETNLGTGLALGIRGGGVFSGHSRNYGGSVTLDFNW